MHVLQIDDLFLSTAEPFDTTKTYRMTAADSTAMATFMANVPGLPPGSNIKVLSSVRPQPSYLVEEVLLSCVHV